MKAIIDAKLVKAVRREESWMILEVEEKVTKYDKDAKERREVNQPVHIFVGKFFFDQLKGWKKGQNKEIEVLIKTEKQTSQAGNEFIRYDIEFTGLAGSMYKDLASDDDEEL